MSSLYGDPPVGNRPGCWGHVNVYDSTNRECRGCGFQTSCRNHVIKLTIENQQGVQQMPIPAAPYYNQYQSYQPAQQSLYPQPMAHLPMQMPAPAPVPVVRYTPPTPAPVQAPVPTYQAPNATRPVQTQQYTQQQGYIPPNTDWYGRSQDPLFFHILSTPPFRPQLPGELFWERVLKNLVLDGLSLAFGHLMLSLRQMVLPPRPEEVPR